MKALSGLLELGKHAPRKRQRHEKTSSSASAMSRVAEVLHSETRYPSLRWPEVRGRSEKVLAEAVHASFHAYIYIYNFRASGGPIPLYYSRYN